MPEFSVGRTLRRTALLVLGLILAGIAHADEWDLSLDKNGIRIYTQPSATSDFRAFRGEVTVEAPLSALVAFHSDVNAVKEWLHDCADSTLLGEFKPDGYYAYFRTAAPWPVDDRDYVLHYRFTQDPESLAVTLHFELAAGFVPQQNDCVPMEALEGFWIMTPLAPSRTHVVYQVAADPGGSLPAWLVNESVITQPYQSLLNLRERVVEARYQGQRFDFIREPEYAVPSP